MKSDFRTAVITAALETASAHTKGTTCQVTAMDVDLFNAGLCFIVRVRVGGARSGDLFIRVNYFDDGTTYAKVS